MPAPLSIAIHGAGGRMGQALIRIAQAADDIDVIAGLVRRGSPLEGRAVAATADALSNARTLHFATTLESTNPITVLVDFSVADAFDDVLRMAVDHRCAFVSGTTGIDARQRGALDRAALTIPVLWSANFSLGVAVLTRLAADAAAALQQWDCEIGEAHHAGKRDAPSGTALALGQAIAAARAQDFSDVAALTRPASTPRAPRSIGFAVTRAGDIVGEHTVILASEGERIELTHRATDRDIFARGALAAARWIAGRASGIYCMADVVRA